MEVNVGIEAKASPKQTPKQFQKEAEACRITHTYAVEHHIGMEVNIEIYLLREKYMLIFISYPLM